MQAQINFTLVLLVIANVSRLSENNHFFAKIAKNTKTVLASSFFDFTKNRKNMPRVVWAGKFKPGHGFEIRQRQQKCQRKPKVQSPANPAAREREREKKRERKMREKREREK